MKINRFHIYSGIATLLVIVLISLLMIGGASANDQPAYISLVRVMDFKDTSLQNPAGIVFSSRANSFHGINSPEDTSGYSSDWTVTDISVFGHESQSTSLQIGTGNPVNVAMDNQSGRLLMYQETTQQLISVYEDTTGILNPNTTTIQDASHLNLQAPAGLAYDADHDTLYFLDRAGPRLVRVVSQSDGNLTDALIESISLSWAGNIVLNGIAYDPGSGNFHSVSTGEQRLYEFNGNGDMVNFRDLAVFSSYNPQNIFFAPSSDQTDDPLELSFYLVDSGFLGSPENEGLINNNTVGNPGRLLEFSMVQPISNINADYVSTLVKTTLTSNFTKPSPDPCGLVYLQSSNELIISDADVEETKQGITHFMGANLWEVTLGGSVVRTANISPVPYNLPSLVPMTYEPTGVAWNPGSGHFYFSDDNAQAVFDLNPGIDGLFGTADDSWTSFPTYVENGDPEGIAYDSWHDRLFVIDGTNLEVYEYTLDGSLVNQFDVEVFGAIDTESIEFNRISGTLFVLSNLSSRWIFEVDITGSTLINRIDTSANMAVDPAGLAYAPASNGSGDMRFYIVDRRVDNNADPNENDGRLYEMTAPAPSTPGNTPPTVDSGIDQHVTFGDDAILVGSVTDDGLPNPLTHLWTVISGPGVASIVDPNALSTTASFSIPGTYVFRLTAYDGEYYSYDDINVFVTEVEDSLIFELRVVQSSDDAEESPVGEVSLFSPDLELVNDSGIQTVGLRFIGVNLPKNALISNAYIQFQTDEVDSYATSLTLWGEAQDNPGTFLAQSQNISSRIRTSTSVGWSPVPWTLIDEAGLDQRTTNLTTILEEIIARPGWSAGNSMAIIIGGTGRRTARAYDIMPSAAPRLHVEYTISPNDPPVAFNDNYTTSEDTQLSKNREQGVLNNDTDPEGDPLSAFIYTNPTHGTVTLNANGSFVYMPASNYNGTDSFTYYANDGTFNSNVATVTITISPVNDAPIANNQSVSTAEDTAKAITLTASDVDGDPLSWTIVTQPSHGSLSGTAPAVTYTPSPNYNGSDSFSFKVNDGHVDSNVATVSITVTAVNDAPVANNQSVSTAEDTAKAITLTASDVDGDPLSWTIVSQPSHGTLTGTAPAVTYNPSLNYNGSDNFTFKVNDGQLDSNVATVSITVTPVNDAPVANSQAVSTAEDTAKAITLTASDVDGDPLSWIIVSQPSHGSLTGTAPAVTYTPSLNYNGSDSFTFKVNDGQADSNVATVSITVTPVNDAPVADSQSVSTSEDTEVDITLTATDVEGDPLTWIIVTSPTHGSLQGVPPELTYTPDLNYVGSDSFTFKVNDGYLDSNTATVSISVGPVNDAPSSEDDSYTMTDEQILVVTAPGVLGNDSDPDSDPLTAVLVDGPSRGLLTFNSDGSFIYRPYLYFIGIDTFTYYSNDGLQDSNIATVTISVDWTSTMYYLPVIYKK